MKDRLSAPGPRRRLGGRSARARAALLDATVAELLEVGYGRLRLESVAARAGVHKTTVYRRWPDRFALIAEALLDQRSADVPIPDTGSVRDELRLLAQAVATSITAPVGETLTRTLIAEAGHLPEAAAAMRRFWATRSRLAGELVTRAVERGQLPADTDAEQLIEALVGPLYLRLLVTGDPITDAYVDRLVDLLLAGVQAGRT
jgi:AcrR family transcriptional regulator